MTQSGFNFDASALREALTKLPGTSAWERLNPPAPAEIYIPSMHSKALLPEVSIVEGMRGSGKSFWTAVLADDKTRTLIAEVGNIGIPSQLIVKVGFGLDFDNQQFPSPQQIASLLDEGCAPDDIWRSVLLRTAFIVLAKRPFPFDDSVNAAALWVKQNHDQADHYLAECDRDLAERKQVLLLVFDSLDRLADDWGRIRKILSAALKIGLECRTRRAIRFKFFLRPEMVEQDDEIWRFTDSSKLLHNKRELLWRPNDLFGLILLHLANSPSAGQIFREKIERQTLIRWQPIDDMYPLPPGLTGGEEPLRRIVEAIAGPWVGTTAKRGFTFKWIPTHLSDAKGRLSPRSILLAFKSAAEWTAERHPSHKFALHYQGIQQGVVEASTNRIREIKEDYPWVGPLLEALKGATVPLTVEELNERWTEKCIQSSLNAAQKEQRLPPRSYSNTPILEALVDDLVELAVLYRTEDKRFNMPDIFRVGFGIKRKGGVRPPR
jgi:hypothetical protein